MIINIWGRWVFITNGKKTNRQRDRERENARE
jgi:hypothetical protein